MCAMSTFIRAWQALLRFGDAHPWFLPSVAAAITILGFAYKASAGFRRLLKSFSERLEDNLVAGYLMSQVNPGPFTQNAYGHVKPRQKDCTLSQIVFFLKKRPHKIKAILDRLEHQMRAERRGELWHASDYQTKQKVGRFTKMRLYFLHRSYRSRLAKLEAKEKAQPKHA